MTRRGGLTALLLLSALGVCWSGILDRIAAAEAENSLNRVVVAFALSRTLNGLISVAQGTEIALQPAGVGVTLSAGEILDPLNDLIERFSLLALAASVSLGTQLLLAELLSQFWLNLALTGLVAAYLLAELLSAPPLTRQILARITTLALFLRLVVAIVMFTANWLGNLSLADRHATAVAQLADTQQELRALNEQAAGRAAGTPSTDGMGAPRKDAEAPDATRSNNGDSTDGGWLDRVSDFFEDRRSEWDISQRLNDLKERSESAVQHVITLCVIFLLQYIALPIGGFWLAAAGTRAAWSAWLRSNR